MLFRSVVHQHSRVLRVILEFDDVIKAIGAAHQMALRTAAHLANVLDRLDQQITNQQLATSDQPLEFPEPEGLTATGRFSQLPSENRPLRSSRPYITAIATASLCQHAC